MARVYPSAIIASTVMSRSGNCSSNHSAISEHGLGSVHPSWGLLRLGGVKKRQAPDHGPRCSEYSAYLSRLWRADERTRTALLFVTSDNSCVARVCTCVQVPDM